MGNRKKRYNEKRRSRNPNRSTEKELLVWIDCEMTGLDPETDEILEIHCIITSPVLDILDPEGYSSIIHVPKSKLDAMSQWCIDTHTSTNLVADVLASKTTHKQAADGLLAYIKRFVPEPRTALLAGNTVHADKAFLSKGPYKKVVDHLHYRILDVSSIKEAARRWCGPESRVMKEVPRKNAEHRARGDILESIDEAAYYMENIFRPAVEPEDDENEDETAEEERSDVPEGRRKGGASDSHEKEVVKS